MSARPIAVVRGNEGYLANGARALVAELKEARERGLPFIVEWRQSEKTEHSYVGDAGCGCGPTD
jgi:hypothetical protein